MPFGAAQNSGRRRAARSRTEVFDKYYFPAKWEANEMEALVGFLGLEDPSLSSTKLGGIRGGSLRGSSGGKKGGSGNGSGSGSGNAGGGRRGAGENGGRRRGGRLTASWNSLQGSPSSGEGGAAPAVSGAVGGLSSSFTSLFKDSAGKLTKPLVSCASFRVSGLLFS